MIRTFTDDMISDALERNDDRTMAAARDLRCVRQLIWKFKVRRDDVMVRGPASLRFSEFVIDDGLAAERGAIEPAARRLGCAESTVFEHVKRGARPRYFTTGD